MGAPKPTEDLQWASGPSSPSPVITDPPLSKKEQGWVDNEYPPAEYFNWFMNLVYGWQEWLRDFEINNHNWTGQNTFAPTTANTTAVVMSGNGTGLALNAGGGNTSAYAIKGQAGSGSGGDGVHGIGDGLGSGLSGVGGGSAGAAGVTGTSGPSGAGVVGNGASNGNGVNGTGQGTGIGVLGVGGATAQGGAFESGGSNDVGAVNLLPQATPSAPVNGDVWFDTTKNSLAFKANGNVGNAYPQLPAGGPTTLPFNGTWGTSTYAKYWKDINGRVYVDGQFGPGASGSGAAATLPAGFRPASNRSQAFQGMLNHSSVFTLLPISVDTSGNITPNTGYVSGDVIAVQFSFDPSY